MNKKMYDLTNPQKNILSIEKYYSNTAVNTNCGVAEIKEIVDFDKLSQAITLVIKNNPIFNLKFDIIDGNMKQFFSEPISYIPKINELKNESELLNLEKELGRTALFNATYMFNFEIFKFPNQHGGVIGAVHHLIADSWGVGLMFDEILKTYTSLLRGTYEDEVSQYKVSLANISFENEEKMNELKLKIRKLTAKLESMGGKSKK